MTACDVLALAKTSGITIEARGDRLHVEAPAGRLTPELRDALVRHKPEILAWLAPADLVCLNGGTVVPRPALELAFDLEARGFRLSLDTYQQFQIEPTGASGSLTSDDRNGIARWRAHLGAIVGYVAPEPTWLL